MRRHLMFVEVAESMKALLASKEKTGCLAGWLRQPQLEAPHAPAQLMPEAEERCLEGYGGEPALANPTPGQLSAGGGHVQPIPSCTGGQLFAKSAAAELCFV